MSLLVSWKVGGNKVSFALTLFQNCIRKTLTSQAGRSCRLLWRLVGVGARFFGTELLRLFLLGGRYIPAAFCVRNQLTPPFGLSRFFCRSLGMVGVVQVWSGLGQGVVVVCTLGQIRAEHCKVYAAKDAGYTPGHGCPKSMEDCPYPQPAALQGASPCAAATMRLGVPQSPSHS